MKKLLSMFMLVMLLVVATGCNASPGKVSAGKEDKKFTVGIVPKLVGVPYFTAAEKGAKKAGEDFGVEVIYTGSTAANASEQVNVIEDLIGRQVDAVAVSANDAAAVAPALKKARDQGILVLTWDADAEEDSRDYFIAPVDAETLGRHLMDEMAELMNEEGEFGILMGALTASDHNTWIDWSLKHLEENYPNMKAMEREPTDDDRQKAVQAASALITGNSDMKGIIAYSSTAMPGAAEAVQQAGKNGEIKVVGLASPNEMREYLKSDAAQVSVLWEPEKLGYLTIAIAAKVLNGEEVTDGMEIESIGNIKVDDNGGIIMADPSNFKKDNVDDFDF